MKKTFYLFLATIASTCFTLNAQVNTEDISSVQILPPTAERTGSPFKLDISADYIDQADIKNCPHMGHVNFATGTAELNFVYYYEPCYKEGAAIAFAYEQTYLDYNKNPYFNQKNYESGSILLSTFTNRLEDWEWRSQLSINFDNLPSWNFNDYMTYNMLAWGRYSQCENIGLHIGFWAQTGMKFDRVYPIIGFDWTCGDWQINAIFPVNISLVYSINDEWNISLAGRFIDQRHRTKRDQHVHKAFWHYQSGGGEFAINYKPSPSLAANIHAGYSSGGHLTITNEHHHRIARLRLGSAPYAGAEVALHF